MVDSFRNEMRLRMPRQEVQNRIQKQIDEGEDFIKNPIPDERTLKLAKEAMESWYDYTRDLLLKLFNTDRIQKEFAQSVKVGGLGLNFQMRVQEFFQDTDSRLNTLRSILRRLELFEEDIKTDSAPQEKVIKIEKYSLPESKATWKSIENEFGINKIKFGRKINFVSDNFKRNIIFRDVEHSFMLASLGYSKPAVILAGGVIEELLRLYLEYKKIKPEKDSFNGYIKACEKYGILKSGISLLSDSVRHFRNLVHLSVEQSKRYTLSKATAKGAVASIFTIINDFESKEHFTDQVITEVPKRKQQKVVGRTPNEEAAEVELANVQSAVIAMMVDNNLTTLPNPVTVATNDMSTFPDATSICGVDKIQDPQGNAYVGGADKDGYLLYQHDIIGDATQTGLVNYITSRYTKGCYIVDASGTVTQVTTGYEKGSKVTRMP